MLTGKVKARMAAEITRINSVGRELRAPAYVNVVFSELSTDSFFADGEPPHR
ncbi:phenylpyruvate tautomerase PptA (4-oxalocrotonate tautomerase family) [Streptomyces sp. B3I7]|uniref:hypothetical protein n=1 Tax=Streptomyces sp. B3I7 TaxID=3042269 RepID=UPI0027848227|nr:hypothetical protein [Streptomyces sp. B3I7]MDQ0808415.1 phenylpyruvate tautomerase PptA (4-oxalocrotonate tautomerase family) [Streptomyces sp. B3I7]